MLLLHCQPPSSPDPGSPEPTSPPHTLSTGCPRLEQPSLNKI
ncbi:hypothetical protein DB31_5719 [Hyalangium minutum]|uniref:Uncharacterized protein n=1 Tax=Hyalangium minutum TaxID=394096 RepID=A0A085WSL4_9BACT|nr:hypothetical protein DB31_5719 [Hyalangium minutum]